MIDSVTNFGLRLIQAKKQYIVFNFLFN